MNEISTCAIGVDCGAHGAIAALELRDDSTLVLHGLYDMPVWTEVLSTGRQRLRVDAPGLGAVMRRHLDCTRVYVEAVSARAGQGVTSMFALGQAMGIVQGVSAGLGSDVSMVRPQAWRKAVGLEPGQPKAASRALASVLLPNDAFQFKRVRDDGRAEAVLIAFAGLIGQLGMSHTAQGRHRVHMLLRGPILDA